MIYRIIMFVLSLLGMGLVVWLWDCKCSSYAMVNLMIKLFLVFLFLGNIWFMYISIAYTEKDVESFVKENFLS